jgi:hypothetical protein
MLSISDLLDRYANHIISAIIGAICFGFTLFDIYLLTQFYKYLTGG